MKVRPFGVVPALADGERAVDAEAEIGVIPTAQVPHGAREAGVAVEGTIKACEFTGWLQDIIDRSQHTCRTQHRSHWDRSGQVTPPCLTTTSIASIVR